MHTADAAVDPRKRRSIRLALTLAAVALGFYALFIFMQYLRSTAG